MEFNKPGTNYYPIMRTDRSKDLNLVLFCGTAHGLNPDLIENSKVLRSLIDYQFEKTFKVFNI